VPLPATYVAVEVGARDYLAGSPLAPAFHVGVEQGADSFRLATQSRSVHRANPRSTRVGAACLSWNWLAHGFEPGPRLKGWTLPVGNGPLTEPDGTWPLVHRLVYARWDAGDSEMLGLPITRICQGSSRGAVPR
jgi:hypothetical protein